MRILLLVSGFVVTLIAMLVEADTHAHATVHPGFFWVAAAMIVAAPFWKSERPGKWYAVRAAAVYSVLAQAPREMASLAKEARKLTFDIGDEGEVEQVIATMLDNGSVRISNGLVELADGSSAKRAPETDQEA